MNPMQLIEHLPYWKGDTIWLTIKMKSDFNSKEKVICGLKKILIKAQLSPNNRYFYTLQKVKPLQESRAHSRCISWIPTMLLRQPTLWQAVIKKHKGERTLPKNYDCLSVDPFTYETFSENDLDSPHTIFLPSYVASAKGVVRTILERGTTVFRDPVDNRVYDGEERKRLLQQIDRIFGVSKKGFFSCFGPIPPLGEKLENVALDKNGQYSEKAKESIAFIMNELKDPSLSLIDKCLNEIEGIIQKIIPVLDKHPAFRERVENYSTICQNDLKKNPLDPGTPNSFVKFKPLNLSFRISDLSLEYEMDINRLISLAIYKQFGHSDIQIPARIEFARLKLDYIRRIKLDILRFTPFFDDLEQEYRAKMRTKRFERLSGVSLTI